MNTNDIKRVSAWTILLTSLVIAVLLAYITTEMLKFGGLIVLSLILYLLKTKTEKYLDKLDDEKQPGFHDLLYILPISILTFIVSMFIFYIYTTDDKQIVEALEVIKYYTIK